MPRRYLDSSRGFSLVEVLFTLAICSVILVAFAGVFRHVHGVWEQTTEREELFAQADFALERIATAVSRSRFVLLPLPDNPATVQAESRRNSLAMTVDPFADRNNDGVFDGDNDGDGKVDEDLPPDNSNDNAPGIMELDDDQDGAVDEGSLADNDEDGQRGEDWIDGLDNDGDGRIDEDIPKDNRSPGVNIADNDGDGRNNEDWFDVLAFFVDQTGRKLMERRPNFNPVNGRDFSEHVLAEAATVSVVSERLPEIANDRWPLIRITLGLTGESGESVSLQAVVRAGGAL